ncbi:MAG: tRNA (adenine(22)-N(1))-methyltransferase [Acutalibacteraceae bacterium]
MKLSKRLEMVASFVRQGSVVADIGTDHAYLPVYLISHGISEKAFAADIGRGPLLNAEKTVTEYGLNDKITLVLSDGLKEINLSAVDTVILAGMGGDLIKDILSCADIEALKKIHIIAQPQSHAEKVRGFLIQNGFEIEREDICLDAKHVYICMCASFSGKTEYPCSYEYYGELIKNDNELVKPFLENQIMHMRKKRDAMIKASSRSEEAKMLSETINNIEKAIGEK